MNVSRPDVVRLALFGHNRKDAAIVRRALAFSRAGVDVTGVTYRRDGEAEQPAPDWNKIDLGYVEHCQHAKRIVTHLKAMWRILVNRRRLRDMDIFYARNLDMLMLSFFALPFIGENKPAVVYECLDVHAALTRDSLKAALLRWLERQALKRINLLVISSPGFLREYFVPYQGYREPTYLLENKLYIDKQPVSRPDPRRINANSDERLVLAWVGILRCQLTLDLLKQLASSASDRILIRLHGMVSEFLISDFESQLEALANIQYMGPYRYPEGLSDAYSGAHFVWAQELSWSGHNSDWLIPNRVYEGSYFGTLSLAVAGTETARIVAERDLGYVLKDSHPQTLIDFVRNADPAELAMKRQALLTRPRSDFVAEQEEITRLLQLAVSPGPRRKQP